MRKFCESCKSYQVRRTLTYRDRILIEPITRLDNPFEVCRVDCIVPFEPFSEEYRNTSFVHFLYVQDGPKQYQPEIYVPIHRAIYMWMQIFTHILFPRIF